MSLRTLGLLLGTLTALGCAPAAIEDTATDEGGVDERSVEEVRATEQFYTVRRDGRRCAFPRCGGYYLARVGRSSTRCGDGRLLASCYVPTLTVAGLTGEDRERVLNAPTTSTTTTALIVSATLDGSDARVAQAWIGSSGAGPTTGTLRQVYRPACAPNARCAGLVSRALSNGRTTTLAMVDFGASPGTDEELSAADAATRTQVGIITTGALAQTPSGNSLEVVQYWLPALATPTTGAGLCGDDLRASLEATTAGLLMPSESDYPFEYVAHEGAGGEALTVERFRELFGVDAGTSVETRTLEDQFRWIATVRDDMTPEERAQAERFAALRDSLRANLTDVQVFRVGTIQIRVYMIGRTRCGAVAGVSTTVIET